MTVAKKFIKKLIAFVLTTAFVIFSFSTQTFAAGTETWYSAQVIESTMTITNNNLTPIKTMGVSGTLHITASIKGRSDLEPSGCPKVQLTVQIRDTSGNVLATGTVREDAFMPQVDLEIPVTKGQQYRIFFDVSSVSYNPNGNYRIADVTYSHEIY